MVARRKLTSLEKVKKAQGQIVQAWRLVKSEHMAAEYVDVALAQLAVAYKNLEAYRKHCLLGAPKEENAIITMANLIEASQGDSTLPTMPRLLPGPVDSIVTVNFEGLQRET